MDKSVAAVIQKNEGIYHLTVNCHALIEVAIKGVDKIISLCAGIQGAVYGSATVIPGYNTDAAIPINLVFDTLIWDEHHNPVIIGGEGVQQQGGEIEITEVSDGDDNSIDEEAGESDIGRADDLGDDDEEG